MIERHYDQAREDERLAGAWGQLDLARTQEILRRHLPPPPAAVLDIGGGPGVYSRWLAGEGYEAHLIDLVPKHVEQARAGGGIASASVGDARSVARPDASADAVLLLGPLYHLIAREDRLLALREARRLLRPGAVLFAAAISRFASLLDSVVRGFLDDPAFAPILERDLREGQHRNPTGNVDYFTTAFFHLPAELRAEIEESGFSLLELVGVEGPAWLAGNFEQRWADPMSRERLLEAARCVENDVNLMVVSLHLLAAATVAPASAGEVAS